MGRSACPASGPLAGTIIKEVSAVLEFQLTEEQETLRKTVEEFAREVVAPQAFTADETGEFPYQVVRQMGEMGLFGLPFPEEYGGMGGDYFALCLAIEELARADSSVAITLEAGVSLGAMPVYRFGSAAAEAGMAAPAHLRPGARGVRAHRARRRLGCGGDAHPRPPGRRRMGHRRVEGLHHERRHRHLLPGHRDRCHRRRRRRAQEDLLDPGSRSTPRVPGVEEVLEGGLARLGHPASCRSRAAACRKKTCSVSVAGGTPTS